MPKSYANIDTLADLDESGIRIAVLYAGLIVDIFGEEPPGSHLGNLRQKLFGLDLDHDLMGDIARQGKVAGLERLLSMPKIFHDHVRSDGSSYLHIVKECPR